MNNQELFYKIEKLIDAKMKSEESSYEEQNKILRELINKKDKIDKEYLKEIKELKKEIKTLQYTKEYKLIKDTFNKFENNSIAYGCILLFGLLSIIIMCSKCV